MRSKSVPEPLPGSIQASFSLRIDSWRSPGPENGPQTPKTRDGPPQPLSRLQTGPQTESAAGQPRVSSRATARAWQVRVVTTPALVPDTAWIVKP